MEPHNLVQKWFPDDDGLSDGSPCTADSDCSTQMCTDGFCGDGSALQLTSSVAIEVSAEAISAMMEDPDKTVGGLATGYANYIGVSKDFVSVQSTNPDLYGSGGRQLSRQLLHPGLTVYSLTVEYVVELPADQFADVENSLTSTDDGDLGGGSMMVDLGSSLSDSLALAGIEAAVTVTSANLVEERQDLKSAMTITPLSCVNHVVTEDGIETDACTLYEGGWATLDHDSLDDYYSPIWLTIESKSAHNDYLKVEHGATVGDLVDETATNGRYVLACPQAAGQKTLQFTIHRPKDMTAFGGEWVKLFKKDSWVNVTNEYEPFTFNSFGAKVPLLRMPATQHESVAESTDELIVYMEVKDTGDFEVKYGNPMLHINGRWVANEFKKTTLRVGNPWADCGDGASLGTVQYNGVGTVIPAFYGQPRLNLNTYSDLISELTDVAVQVKVVLEIFSKKVKTWTSSTNFASTYTKCYKAGNPCPESHIVCAAEYCELDTWLQIIADLKDASPGYVAVVGAVDADTTPDSYSQLPMDGFFYSDPTDLYTSLSYDVPFSIVALGEPLFDESVVQDADIWIPLIEDFSKLGVWTPFAWFPEELASRWAGIVHSVNPAPLVVDIVDVLFDRGYGFVFATSSSDFTTASAETPALLAALEAKAGVRRARRLEDSATAEADFAAGSRSLALHELGNDEERGNTNAAVEVTADVDDKPYWACDDTLTDCSPVCLQRTGLVTNRVGPTACNDAPKDECECASKCYYDVKWVCGDDGDVVCVAKQGKKEPRLIGDLLCSSRGTPKPERSDMKSCEKAVSIGTVPDESCLLSSTPTPGAENGPLLFGSGAIFVRLLLALFVTD
jgi:hypothetical protein